MIWAHLVEVHVLCADQEVETDRVLTTGPGDIYIDTNNYWTLVTALSVATHLTPDTPE